MNQLRYKSITQIILPITFGQYCGSHVDPWSRLVGYIVKCKLLGISWRLVWCFYYRIANQLRIYIYIILQCELRWWWSQGDGIHDPMLRAIEENREILVWGRLIASIYLCIYIKHTLFAILDQNNIRSMGHCDIEWNWSLFAWHGKFGLFGIAKRQNIIVLQLGVVCVSPPPYSNNATKMDGNRAQKGNRLSSRHLV